MRHKHTLSESYRKRPVTYSLTTPIIKGLQRVAEAEGTTPSHVLRELLGPWLQRRLRQLAVANRDSALVSLINSLAAAATVILQ